MSNELKTHGGVEHPGFAPDYEVPDGYLDVTDLGGPPKLLDPEGQQVDAYTLRPIKHGRQEVESWMDADPSILNQALDRRLRNRRALMAWLWDTLKEGTDYGRIKQGQKPSLWQPGAEKICGYLNLRAVFPDNEKYVDAAVSGIRVEDIIVRCYLIDQSGEVQGQGMGARSPAETPILNNRIKMAQKSAHIDAAKRTAGLSEVFSQDDMEEPAGGPIDEAQQNGLKDLAEELFPGKALAVLQSLAKMRFGIEDGDWTKIFAIYYGSAKASLRQKAEAGWESET